VDYLSTETSPDKANLQTLGVTLPVPVDSQGKLIRFAGGVSSLQKLCHHTFVADQIGSFCFPFSLNDAHKLPSLTHTPHFKKVHGQLIRFRRNRSLKNYLLQAFRYSQ
jgi:hypothetical protein